MKSKLIKIFCLFPLKLRIKIYYFIKHKSIVSFDNEIKYSEKIQKRKLNILPIYTRLSDKFLVREFIENKIGSKYLIPLISVNKTIDDVDFSVLPNKFVIKTNFGSGNNHIEIVKNKNNIDYEYIKDKFRKAYMESYIGSILGETQYDEIPKKIIIEEFIDNKDGDIEDFKFHIFNSSDGFLQVDFDRFSDHKRNLYDLDWNRLNYDLLYTGGQYNLPKVEELNKLKEIAFGLSEGFDYVRVDLYLVDGKVLFGEMTFTPGSGFEPFSDIKADYKYGNIWLESKK